MLAGCGGADHAASQSSVVEAVTDARATGVVTIRVLGDRVVDSAISATPIAGVSVYDGDWHAVQPMGQTDASGSYVATLSKGTHAISVMMMTSSHSLLQSVGNSVRVTSQPTTLDIHVAPTEVQIWSTYDVGWGNALYVTGESDYLGNWTTAYKLGWQSYQSRWLYQQDLPIGAQFKLIVAPWTDGDSLSVHAAGVKWEQGDNHVITPPYQNYYSDLRIDPTF
jgi:hypothetical protein